MNSDFTYSFIWLPNDSLKEDNVSEPYFMQFERYLVIYLKNILNTF